MSQVPETKESMARGVSSTHMWMGLAKISTRRRAMGVPLGFWVIWVAKKMLVSDVWGQYQSINQQSLGRTICHNSNHYISPSCPPEYPERFDQTFCCKSDIPCPLIEQDNNLLTKKMWLIFFWPDLIPVDLYSPLITDVWFLVHTMPP